MSDFYYIRCSGMVFPESRIAIIKQVVGFKITGFCLSNLSMSFRFIGNWIL